MRTPAAAVIVVAAVQCLAASRIAAQDTNGLRVVLKVYTAHPDRGDRLSTAASVDPANIGKTVTTAFSRLTGQCGSGVGGGPVADMGQASDGSMKKVYSAWATHVTPTARQGEAVTFRVAWERSRDNGKPSSVSDDTEVTLRPGQSMVLDVMPQTAEKSEPPPGCVVRSMVLTAAVERDPVPDQDRRLLAVDLWLVERLADGKERSQALELRGLYNSPIPFYFETVTEGGKSVDVFGDLQVSPGTPASEMKITTKSRVTPSLRPAYAGYYVGSTTGTLQVKPDEVVSVALPEVGHPQGDAGAFAARALSYRIRVRQLR